MVDTDNIRRIMLVCGLNYKKFLKYSKREAEMLDFRKQLTSEYIKGVQK